MQERRNPDSFYKDFISMLPTDMSSFPLFYSDKDLEWLRGSDTMTAVNNQKEKLSSHYNAITGSILGFSD